MLGHPCPVRRTTSRMVSGDKGWPGPERWGRDNMWIKSDEVADLARGRLPESLKQRVFKIMWDYYAENDPRN